ncbi:DUF2017 domain-containing protein [Actinomadura sp. DC4]|uniref:DUF2017 domain-containing protein n=1 Tax=Actinomadura sp. DC4 TaxID=3055069 RepID=UPI0025B0DBBE|nr:DUF2017 domain-containing protein [Actinomadura sp. DC4]MDN3351706.1 DUF2017 domain-containing protein [Actinomadura sp. DC4]
MNGGFSSARGGQVCLRMGAEEASVVRLLVGQLLDLIGESDESETTFEGMPDLRLSDNTSVPEDPVLARLFPDAYREDQGASAEFRRYTEGSLREGKRAAAQTVLRTLGEGGTVYLDPEQAQAWLRALNDLRLALGTRLDITEETLEQMRTFDWDDPRNAGYAAYDWLTYLQESLVRALW